MDAQATQPCDAPDRDVLPGSAGRIGAMVAGNQLQVIEHGPDLLSALIALIDEARVSLKLYYYIFAADESGGKVLNALLAARQRGVAVTLIIDAFGSANTPDMTFDALRRAGGRFAWFGMGRSTRYLIRNHQKMAIADNQCALIGGFNVADDYFGQAEDGCWHDVGLLVEGEVAARLSRWYRLLDKWTFSTRQRFGWLRAMVRRWQRGAGPLQWAIGGPTRFLSPWARQVKHDLQNGRQLDMIEAYFAPGRGMLRRMGQVARRDGARLVLPSLSDNGATIGAARFLYRGMLRRGITLFEYQPCKLHMKLIVIDDIVYIGSANFDMRSLFLNLELMLRIEDAQFAQQMRQFVARRIQDSRQIHVVDVASAGWLTRVKWWASYLLVGVVDYTVTRRLNFRS